MKQIITFSFLMLFAATLMAQPPANDDCGGLIDLGEAPYCPALGDVYFSNVDATPSDALPGIEAPSSCDGLGEPQTDVWFSFVASDTIFDYTITVTGADDPNVADDVPMTMPVVVIYRAEEGCSDLQELECEAAGIGDGDLSMSVFSELTPGFTYYLRVFDFSLTGTPNSGTFQLCVVETPPDVELCEDENFTTNDCEGIVYDCGGPDGDYTPNTNSTLTIQPSGVIGCINFSLLYYNLEVGFDMLTFYDGPDTNSPVITVLSGGQNGDNSGGACLEIQASSGALTIQFQTDGMGEYEGFMGTWSCSPEECVVDELITVTAGEDVTNEDIVDAITTPQTTITITDINCPDGAYGLFENGDNTNLGLDQGIVLSSGSVIDDPLTGTIGISNPATIPGFISASTNNEAMGDSDLDYLSELNGGSLSFDACVIELDVFAATNELVFEYVFGSEEYPEFVGGNFNDIFAFLISGPGIVGDPLMDDQLNIAVLPDDLNTPVEINSVNDSQNWEYYRDNSDGVSIVYDGLTSDFQGVKKSLTASAEVIPCNTYHLKLAVADRADGILDSGVFVSEIQGGTPEIVVNYSSGIDYFVEECTTTPDVIEITLDEPAEDDTSFDVIIGGTATIGVDYNLDIPSVIVIPAGEISVSYPITINADGIAEGTENISILLSNDFGCGSTILEELIVNIEDNLTVEINGGDPEIFVCADSTLQIFATGAPNYAWQPSAIFDNINSSEPIVSPTQNTTIYVVGLLGVCTDIDTAELVIVDPMLTITTPDVTNICEGESVNLTADNNVASTNLMWTGANLDDPTATTVVASPTVTTEYTAQVEVAGCTAQDTLIVNVDPFDFPTLTPDTLICQSYDVQLAEQIDNVTTQYQWSPGIGLMPSDTVSGPFATPPSTTTYTLTATSENNYCTQSESITVTVFPAEITIQNPDTIEICLGEQVNLSALTSTPGTGFQWTPTEGLVGDPTSEDIIAMPTVSTMYYTELVVGECFVQDSVFIRVDSIPESALVGLIPDKDTYCLGEQVVFEFPMFDLADYEDMEHMWTPNLGILSTDSTWNLVIEATETTTYTRISTNHACMDTVMVDITVIDVGDLMVTPETSTICPGESVQLMATSTSPDVEFSWNNEGSLTCDDCEDPVASPNGNTTYTVTAMIEGCNVNATTLVEVIDGPDYDVINDAALCPGETISLNLLPEDPDATYVWTDQDGNVISNDFNPEVQPATTTTYTLTITVPGGCPPEMESVTIGVEDEPTLEPLENQTICQGDTAIFVANGSIGGTYTWTPTDTEGAALEIIGNDAGVFEYTVQFEYCGLILEETVTLTVIESINISEVEVPANAVFEASQFDVNAIFTPNPLDGAMFQWYYNLDLAGSVGPMTQLTAPLIDVDSMDVEFSLIITNAEGCMDEFVFDVSVKDSDDEIPTAFSPNGDGLNDFFNHKFSENLIVSDFRIYNRWGQQVYNNETPATGWNGMYKDKPAPTDVYVYIVVYTDDSGVEQMQTGDVTLLR